MVFIMKKKCKVKILILTMMMILSFMGCNGRENKTAETIKASDFSLTIEASKNVFSKDEEIEVDISLMNNLSFDIEIAYFLLFAPLIPTATNYPVATEMPPEPYIKIFNNSETISLKDNLGGCFDPGLHEIKYKAKFYVNWGEENEQMIEVWSNTIQIEIDNS